MEQIWRGVCTHYQVPDHVASTWYKRIRNQLSSSDALRAYHNWEEMMLHKQKHLEGCKPILVLAALFQYYHFDGNNSCVKLNCEAFQEFCQDAMIEDEECKVVVPVLLGQAPVPNRYSDESNLLQDIDLAILAVSTEDYKHYTQLLRLEYIQLCDDSYKMMRLKKKGSRKIQPYNPNGSYAYKLYNSLRRRARRRINSGDKTLSSVNTAIPRQSKTSKQLFTKNQSNTSNKKINANIKKKPTNRNSLEEGEIISFADSDLDDDDCMIIDSTEVNITILDDELPSTSFSSTALVTSTPFVKANSKKRKKNDLSSTLPKLLATEIFLEDRNTIYQSATGMPKPPLYQVLVNEETPLLKYDNSDVICIDGAMPIIKPSEPLPQLLEDSVIFVSETKPQENNFIPLESSDVPNPIEISSESEIKTPLRKSVDNGLFTASEQKQLKEYNRNAYNPEKLKPCGKKRMVLIDGSNVAFGHALSKEFSVRGIQICIDYFVKMGHEVKAVVPSFRRNMYKSTDPTMIDDLNSKGYIVLTPCKNLPGLNSTSYDDRFILQLACELDAAIVSNDNYRDLIHESSAFKKIIENRVIGYTWCNDIFILPKDPYGRWGPTLDSILNRS